MIKGVIFDLDGVLVFTDEFHYLAWKKLADEEGIPFTREDNNALRGVSRMASLELVLKKASKTYSDEEKVAMAEKKNNYYREYLSTMSEKDVTPETLSFLKELREKGYKTAIGSSSKNAPMILKQVGLAPYFDAIIDGNQISKSKPDPEVFLKAAEALNLPVSECCIVEDAKAGVKAGKDGGFLTFGLSDAKDSTDCDKPIDCLSEIIPILEKEGASHIRLEHIGKVYPNGYEAVKDFSLDINDGEFVVLVGPSGCGKSTVLRMLAGLEETTRGKIYLNGEDITYKESRVRDLAMVFQNYALYPHLSVRKNIAFPLSIEKIPLKKFFSWSYRKERKAKIAKEVEEAAEKMGLTEYLDEKPANLSGGQRQRVALGRALVRHPKAFLLDEPLSNLDAKMRVSMRGEILRLHESLKAIFVYVTHDQVEAMTMGDKIVVIKDGDIQQVGTPEEIFLNPKNIFVASFIGTPQMNFFPTIVLEKDGNLCVNVEKVIVDQPLHGERFASFNKDKVATRVTMGIRPKSLKVEGGEGYEEKYAMNATVNLVEQLGEETLLYLTIDGVKGDFTTSVDGIGKHHKGERIKLSLDLSSACFFDETKGNSII